VSDRTAGQEADRSADRAHPWTLAQRGLLAICVLHVVQAIVGFLVEPSFAIGPDAPTTPVLGMDYNGWHALAGFALFAPGLYFATRSSWAVAYLLLAAVAGMAPGVWALFSTNVAWIFHFPNNRTDAVVHLVTGVVMIAIAAVQVRRDGGLRESLADLRG
jgi:hypothetical protein